MMVLVIMGGKEGENDERKYKIITFIQTFKCTNKSQVSKYSPTSPPCI